LEQLKDLVNEFQNDLKEYTQELSTKTKQLFAPLPSNKTNVILIVISIKNKLRNAPSFKTNSNQLLKLLLNVVLVSDTMMMKKIAMTVISSI